jgi:ABC-type transport system substrate-binding protein
VRAAAYRRFQEIFAQDLPAVLLYTPTFQYVVRSDLQGLSPGLLLTHSSRFDGIERWRLQGVSGG